MNNRRNLRIISIIVLLFLNINSAYAGFPYANTYSVNVGDTFQLNAVIKDTDALEPMELLLINHSMTLSYDIEYVAFISAESGHIFYPDKARWDVFTTSNTVTVYEGIVSGIPKKVSGNLANFTFRALKATELSDIYITNAEWDGQVLYPPGGPYNPKVYAHIVITGDGNGTPPPPESPPTTPPETIPPDNGISSSITSAFSSAIVSGLTDFLYFIGDSMMSLDGNNEKSPGAIFTLITYNLDPYKLEFVEKWNNISIVFYAILSVLYLLLGGTMALISTCSPKSFQRFTWFVTGTYDNFFAVKEWAGNVFLSLLFPVGLILGIYSLLELSFIATGMLTTAALTAIPPTIDNVIAYLFMAFAYLLMSVFMGLREIIIVLFAAGGFILAALYIFPAMRGLVISMAMYCTLVIFLQPLLVFIAAVGMTLITANPIAEAIGGSVLYFSLIVLMFATGFVFILGYRTIWKMIFFGRYLL